MLLCYIFIKSVSYSSRKNKILCCSLKARHACGASESAVFPVTGRGRACGQEKQPAGQSGPAGPRRGGPPGLGVGAPRGGGGRQQGRLPRVPGPGSVLAPALVPRPCLRPLRRVRQLRSAAQGHGPPRPSLPPSSFGVPMLLSAGSLSLCTVCHWVLKPLARAASPPARCPPGHRGAGSSSPAGAPPWVPTTGMSQSPGKPCITAAPPSSTPCTCDGAPTEGAGAGAGSQRTVRARWPLAGPQGPPWGSEATGGKVRRRPSLISKETRAGHVRGSPRVPDHQV